MLRERMKRWRHVFKLDPNRSLSDLALEKILTSGTDAVIIGGTDGITYRNTRELIDRVLDYAVDCVQEVTNQEAVIPGLDGYLLPVVLNTRDIQWMIGAQHQAAKKFGDWIPWEDTAALGYVVLNARSRVGRLTDSQADLTTRDVAAYAQLAEHLYGLPALYLEYSGTFGDPKMVEAVRESVSDIQLIYGGGISRGDEAKEMARWADTTVVGNLVYRNVDAALGTVSAIKEEIEEQVR
ncbi:putative glycerol-1-phosphate prenyltransferase [Marininema mesophilum]|uniref:Heptaprenylglyceryl phosphate synthase n=2 Tax=Marininema mesophilum TaxID=1048340 RepID=A0A1H2YY13_9BACL|nr:putative glycerol-1-phosphate prenyltransferase [Marininema mesophilum]